MATIYCTRCGHVGPQRTITPGSFVTELFLWILCLLPGLIYSIWRLAARHTGCPQCEAREIIPAGSPIAQQAIQAKYGTGACLPRND